MAKKAKQANLEPIIAKIVEIHAKKLDRTDSDTMRLIVQEYETLKLITIFVGIKQRVLKENKNHYQYVRVVR